MYKNFKPYKFKPKAENISDYANYKTLAELKRPGAYTAIRFVTNDPDGWTIDMIHYKIKSGEITLNEGVNAKSFDGWVDYLLGQGYELSK